MEPKTILTALISFVLGALLVSIAATTFEKDRLQESKSEMTSEHSDE